MTLNFKPFKYQIFSLIQKQKATFVNQNAL